jgi:hypothetical protein
MDSVDSATPESAPGLKSSLRILIFLELQHTSYSRLYRPCIRQSHIRNARVDCSQEKSLLTVNEECMIQGNESKSGAAMLAQHIVAAARAQIQFDILNWSTVRVSTGFEGLELGVSAQLLCWKKERSGDRKKK